MENEIIRKKKIEPNWEKLGVYIACLGFLFLFWQGQMHVMEKIADLRERTAKLEVLIKKGD